MASLHYTTSQLPAAPSSFGVSCSCTLEREFSLSATLKFACTVWSLIHRITYQCYINKVSIFSYLTIGVKCWQALFSTASTRAVCCKVGRCPPVTLCLQQLLVWLLLVKKWRGWPSYQRSDKQHSCPVDLSGFVVSLVILAPTSIGLKPMLSVLWMQLCYFDTGIVFNAASPHCTIRLLSFSFFFFYLALVHWYLHFTFVFVL